MKRPRPLLGVALMMIVPTLMIVYTISWMLAMVEHTASSLPSRLCSDVRSVNTTLYQGYDLKDVTLEHLKQKTLQSNCR